MQPQRIRPMSLLVGVSSSSIVCESLSKKETEVSVYTPKLSSKTSRGRIRLRGGRIRPWLVRSDLRRHLAFCLKISLAGDEEDAVGGEIEVNLYQRCQIWARERRGDRLSGGVTGRGWSDFRGHTVQLDVEQIVSRRLDMEMTLSI